MSLLYLLVIHHLLVLFQHVHFSSEHVILHFTPLSPHDSSFLNGMLLSDQFLTFDINFNQFSLLRNVVFRLLCIFLYEPIILLFSYFPGLFYVLIDFLHNDEIPEILCLALPLFQLACLHHASGDGVVAYARIYS